MWTAKDPEGEGEEQLGTGAEPGTASRALPGDAGAAPTAQARCCCTSGTSARVLEGKTAHWDNQHLRGGSCLILLPCLLSPEWEADGRSSSRFTEICAFLFVCGLFCWVGFFFVCLLLFFLGGKAWVLFVVFFFLNLWGCFYLPLLY